MTRPADAVQCPSCQASSPAGKVYCGDCGAPLDPERAAVASYLRAHLPAEVTAIVEARFKGDKAVELETSERIAERFMKWAKLVGFFLGIPIVALAAFLSFLGIKTYGDLTEQLDQTTEAAAQLEVARTQLGSVQQQLEQLVTDAGRIEERADAVLATAAQLDEELADARAQLAAIPELEERQASLEAGLRAIEERIGFQASEALTPALRASLEEALGRYLDYLDRVGFDAPEARVTLRIDPDLQSQAYYSGADRTVVIAANIAEDLGVALREYTHHVLLAEAGARVPAQGAVGAIESALADYFPASFADDPLVGAVFARRAGLERGFIRNLDNQRSFEELAGLAPNVILYEGAEIWGGVFWAVRAILGRDATDRLLATAWSRFAAAGAPNDPTAFVGHVLAAATTLEDVADPAPIRAVFERRGFPVESR